MTPVAAQAKQKIALLKQNRCRNRIFLITLEFMDRIRLNARAV